MDDNNHTDINLNNIYLIFNHLDILCIIPQFFLPGGLQDFMTIAIDEWLKFMFWTCLSSFTLFYQKCCSSCSNCWIPATILPLPFLSVFFLNYWEIIWKECFFRHPMIWKIWFYLYAIIYSFILAWVIGALLWYVLIFYE